MCQKEGVFYALLRPAMFSLGVATAYQSWVCAEPAWLTALFVIAGGIFYLPLGRLWTLVNPLIAMAYLVHLSWLALQSVGWL